MQPPTVKIRVSVPAQRLWLLDAATGRPLRSWPVSTGAAGTGSESGSLRTPLGRHAVCAKIGAGFPSGQIFRARRPVADPCDPRSPDDLVATRILWLDGQEPHNRNTRERYIYIHGTNREADIGRPASHGCVRMRNADIIALFDLVPEGCEVEIE
jgi:lipoprotein-anchoring transpeptidase ErfK/SrfK